MDLKAMVHNAMGVLSTMMQGAPPPRNQFPEGMTAQMGERGPTIKADEANIGGGGQRASGRLE